jgi:hypothetical protein
MIAQMLPTDQDVVLSGNGRSAIVLLRGDPAKAACETSRPSRSITLAPGARHHLAKKHDSGQDVSCVMSERQLYRVYHVMDTIVRARPTLELRISVDFRGWYPRVSLDSDNTPLPLSGFSDPDTLASITPPQLISLAFGATTPLAPGPLASMVSGCFQLSHLTIEGWCDDGALTVVAKALPRLSTLVIKNAPKLSDTSLQFASSFLTCLRSLELCECPQVTDKGFAAIVRGSSEQLKHLNISFCERVTDLTLTQVSASCGRSLLTLDVSGNSLVSPQGLLMLFTEQCKLEELHVNFNAGLLNIDVLEAILEYGWTVHKISAAFAHVENSFGTMPLVQKLRSRGCDVMC